MFKTLRLKKVRIIAPKMPRHVAPSALRNESATTPAPQATHMHMSSLVFSFITFLSAIPR